VTDETRKKLQKEIFDIFLEVKRVCEELDIPYFIMGGTALGAVRHGGFIPWDDDFDIGMAREHYETFISHAAQKLRPGYFLQSFQTEKRSPFYFAKVRKDHTEFIERYCRKLPIHQGIYIDIFPYDAVPDDEKERQAYYRKGRWYLNWYIAKEVTGISTNPGRFKRLLLEGMRSIMHILMLPVPKQVIYRRVDRYLRRHNHRNTKYLGYAGLVRIQAPREDVMHPDKILFENVEVSCPGHIHEYLVGNFGNYLELPPEEKRGGHDVYKMSL
jgi:lipopolysaccharide cholinephosphotransferase